MTLANLRALTRAMTPGAKIRVIDNVVLDLVLNEGVKDIAAYTLCLKANKKFDVVADQEEYDLTAEVNNFLNVDKSGLWWYNGSIWRPVYPRTLKWLDENMPNWRSLSSNYPQYYAIEANILTVVNKPSSALSDGFWLYYGETPTRMTNSTHYPFSGTTTERSQLSIFDMSIVKYAKWQIEPMLNKDQDSNLSLGEYKREREEKMDLLYTRKDIAHSTDTRMQGPRAGC